MGTENRSKVKSQKSKVKKAQKTDKTVAIFYVTNNGLGLARRIKTLFPDARVMKFNSGSALHELPRLWNECKGLVFIMAAGIVVRAIAPLLQDKRTDPAVVVLDEKGSFAISLLSGHIGGANALALEIAEHTGAQAVITTASDVQGKVALDLWAAEKKLFIEDFEKIKRLSAKIVNGKKIRIKSDYTFRDLPEEFVITDTLKEADAVITHRLLKKDALYLRPKVLSVGIGCNRGTGKEEIEAAVKEIFQKQTLSVNSIGGLSTIDLKRDEKGLLEFARDNNLNIDFFPAEELNRAVIEENIEISEAAAAATGAMAVAEPAALLGAEKMYGKGSIIVPKIKRGNVTLAVAKAEYTL